MTTNKELREMAEKAGSGHWYEVGELRYHDDRSGETHGLHHDEDGFIAAANPATIMALLDSYEDLRIECEKLRKVAGQYRRLIELGEDFQWENIIRVDISDFPSRAAAIDTAIWGNQLRKR